MRIGPIFYPSPIRPTAELEELQHYTAQGDDTCAYKPLYFMPILINYRVLGSLSQFEQPLSDFLDW